MSCDENKELIKGYDQLLIILKSLKECKRLFGRREDDPEKELRSLLFSMGHCEDFSINLAASVTIKSIIEAEGEHIKYEKLESLIINIKNCIHEMQEGEEVFSVIINNLSP